MLTPQRGDAFPAANVAWRGAIILTVVFSIAFVHRIGLSLYVEPLKAALGLTDTEVGILSGVAFALPYTVGGLLCGWLVDRYQRVRLLSLSALLWSAAATALGVVSGFAHMIVARVLTGVGQGAVQPASASLLADLFAPTDRGRAYGLFIAATAFGTAGAYGLGALSITLGEQLAPLLGLSSWRTGLILLGSVGIFAMLSLRYVQEPPRVERALTRPATFAELLRFCSIHSRLVITLFVGATLAFLAPYGQLAFMPSLFIRKYDWSPDKLAVAYGAIAVIAGAGGSLAGGWLVDHWRRRGVSSSPWILCLGGAFLSLAPAAFAPLAESATVSLVWFGVAAIFANWPSIGALAVIADITPNELRGQITAGHTALIGLVSAGLGPVVVGLLTDRVFGTDAALDRSLSVTFAACALMSTLILTLGYRSYRRALQTRLDIG